MFRKQVARTLGSVSSLRVYDERSLADGTVADIAIVDIRSDESGLARLERVHAAAPKAGILVVAGAADPDLILATMRAGANEFFVWPLQEDKLQEAVRRIASKREMAAGRQPAVKLVFLGAKGGVGTTTMAVNCGVELARLSKRPTAIIDLKPGVGEVSLFLGLRPRYGVLDAIDNIQRVDREFLQGLIVKHKSGLDLLAGSENFDRPGPSDGQAVEELIRLMTRQYSYLVIDAGSQINQSTLAALFNSDQTFLVANPDVPSVRNAQRLLERVRQSGVKDEQVLLLLNRTAKSSPIRPKQIESAVGLPIHHSFPSDYQTVSAALNSGVPVALSGDSSIATQFDLFTRRVLDPTMAGGADPGSKKSLLSVERFTGIW